MPTFDLTNQPRFPLVKHDSDSALDINDLQALMCNRRGIMLCVRSASGHPDRGGYFFCISKQANNMYTLETIERVYVDTFSGEQLIRLINHASGRSFDASMLDYCQNSINFRTD